MMNQVVLSIGVAAVSAVLGAFGIVVANLVLENFRAKRDRVYKLRSLLSELEYNETIITTSKLSPRGGRSPLSTMAWEDARGEHLQLPKETDKALRNLYSEIVRFNVMANSFVKGLMNFTNPSADSLATAIDKTADNIKPDLIECRTRLTKAIDSIPSSRADTIRNIVRRFVW